MTPKSLAYAPAGSVFFVINKCHQKASITIIIIGPDQIKI
uniref:Uncharacterized protein n=1 Tax=Klebsiella pneumoniae TaxID=573 RepID=A0A8B0STS6_KLEPN|nr:hypothetical protein [Klebsiella pneumoniae]